MTNPLLCACGHPKELHRNGIAVYYECHSPACSCGFFRDFREEGTEIKPSFSQSLRAQIEEAIPEEKKDDCDDFHDLTKGMAWTPCGNCGLRRDEEPKKGVRYDGWNACRTQALKNLEPLLQRLEGEVKNK